MGYALYGNDLDEQHTPLEAGLGWVVKLDKGGFVGRDALLAQKAAGIRQRLTGFRLRDRAFPRHGYGIRVNGEPAGEVTSGVPPPSPGLGNGMPHRPPDAPHPGRELAVATRDRSVTPETVRPDFYTGGTVRT